MYKPNKKFDLKFSVFILLNDYIWSEEITISLHFSTRWKLEMFMEKIFKYS